MDLLLGVMVLVVLLGLLIVGSHVYERWSERETGRTDHDDPDYQRRMAEYAMRQATRLTLRHMDAAAREERQADSPFYGPPFNPRDVVSPAKSSGSSGFGRPPSWPAPPRKSASRPPGQGGGHGNGRVVPGFVVDPDNDNLFDQERG